jgi:peptidyl-prolyl cis-trans isomerase-like 4
VKYYNFGIFHSIQRNLVAQAGDPLGTGRSGESIFKKLYGDQAAYFEAEVKPRIKHKKLGTVSMVNNGSNMHGSQFFITLSPDIDYLDGQQHTVFGQVAEGFDVLQKFNEAFVDSEYRPYKDIRIFHTVILDDPFDDPTGLDSHIPDRSPEPTKQQIDSFRIAFDEEIDDEKNLDKAEIDERIKQKEAQANAQILEMIGDLPSLDVKPPDNVLFVCKLNPVTTAEDLEVIFARFGHIDSCEVIKDQKTNESLQYAFIEFRDAKACESAYFKMDNVLIDDRRIHVDFSQSVSKIKWKGKGKGVEYKKDEKDEDRPQFRIKDPDLRVDSAYNLVFDDQDEQKKDVQRHNKKKYKHKKQGTSTSYDDLDSTNKEASHDRARSRSTERDKKSKKKAYHKEHTDSIMRHKDGEPSTSRRYKLGESSTYRQEDDIIHSRKKNH